MRNFLRNYYLNLIGSLDKPSPGIHILNAHFVKNGKIDATFSETYNAYLQYLARHCRLTRFEDATSAILRNDIPSDECCIAFSYDDGFEECASIITPILEEFGCNGAFFINSNYIDGNSSYIKGFNNTVGAIEKAPMSWGQIIKLHNNGHIIGSHLLDHFNMASLSNDELELQLITNKKKLETVLNYECNYFAWPFGQFQHLTEDALKLTENHHKYIFSGTNYKNYFSFNGRAINRRHIESFWPENHINYFLSTKKKYNK
jgi:peptidoglycan/xylan/chitin deacetylase (PgdA/CDA1 family)